MPAEGKKWRHVIVSTANSWLPGDARGFRAVKHKVHSSGDYKTPPPNGEHSGLHRYSKSVNGDRVVIPEHLRETVAVAIRDEMNRLPHGFLAISVAGTHCHFLAELPDDRKEIRKIVGEAKRKASVAIRKELPGRVWAHDGKYEPVDTQQHQTNTYFYIWNRQTDAWIWSFKDGLETTFTKKEDHQAPP